MSHEAQTWALRLKTGSGTRKAILMYLANRANTEDGASWPSQRRVAEETEFAERTVRDALKDLEEMGIIRRIARKDTTDLIYLNWEYKGPAAAAGGGGRSSGRGPAGNAAAADSAAVNAGDDRQEAPEVPAADAGGDRRELPPNRKDEPSKNHQDEPSAPRRTAPWPEDYKEQFRKLYPKRHNNDWRSIFIKLEKIEQADAVEFDAIMAGLECYAERMNKRVDEDPKNAEFIALATTWLNQERWLNERPGTRIGSREAGTSRLKAQRLFV